MFIRLVAALALALAIAPISTLAASQKKPLTPSETVVAFYRLLREQRYSEGFALSIYRDIRGAHDWGRRFPEAPGGSVLEKLAAPSASGAGSAGGVAGAGPDLDGKLTPGKRGGRSGARE